MADEDFSSAASVVATLEQQSLRDVRTDLEEAMSEVPVTADFQGGAGGGGTATADGGRDRATQALQSIERSWDQGLRLAEDRNVYLRELLEATENARGGQGGGGGGPFGGLLGPLGELGDTGGEVVGGTALTGAAAALSSSASALTGAATALTAAAGADGISTIVDELTGDGPGSVSVDKPDWTPLAVGEPDALAVDAPESIAVDAPNAIPAVPSERPFPVEDPSPLGVEDVTLDVREPTLSVDDPSPLEVRDAPLSVLTPTLPVETPLLEVRDPSPLGVRTPTLEVEDVPPLELAQDTVGLDYPSSGLPVQDPEVDLETSVSVAVTTRGAAGRRSGERGGLIDQLMRDANNAISSIPGGDAIARFDRAATNALGDLNPLGDGSPFDNSGSETDGSNTQAGTTQSGTTVSVINNVSVSANTDREVERIVERELNQFERSLERQLDSL